MPPHRSDVLGSTNLLASKSLFRLLRNTDRCWILVLLSLPVSLSAASYHLDCASGRDLNDGRTPATAWRTIDRANQQPYGPGDRILLRRGCVWQGAGFIAQGSGSPVAPIVLEDYGDPGQPRPVIIGVGAHEPAVLLLNVQHWIVRNLELSQQGQTPQGLDPNNEKGKDADQYSDEYMRAVVHVLALGPPDVPGCGEDCTVRNIRLENLLVHDGSWNGIYVSGGYYQLRSGRYGFVDNLMIRDVESRNHHKAGVEITCTYYQTRIYATSNVWVLDSHLHHNGGDGAMVGPVRNALLDGNLCEYNGLLRNARVGCWTWDSENTTIQFNESRFNRTPLDNDKARDGAGFDLDLGTENGMLQYNWSHDNQGEGFLLLAYPIGFGYSRGESHNLQMRYNLSERDGQKLGGAITIFGGVAPLVMHNNTIYYEAARSAGTIMFNGEGGALTSSIFGRSGRPDVRAYNNIFITDGTRHPGAVANNVWTDDTGTFQFDHNLWWRVEGGVRFQLGNSAVTSWSGWQAQGFDLNGLNSNPLITGTLGGGPDAYRLRLGSPAIDRGQLVTDALRGMGNQDAFGAFTPQGAGYDIGAFEFATLEHDPGAAQMLLPIPQLDGTWLIRFAGLAGRSYVVQASADLRLWIRHGAAIERAPGQFEFVDRNSYPARFYRAHCRALPGPS